MSTGGRPDEDWVLLCYRLPREPSTPRSAVWRTLKRLGVAQLGDGLVALPADARTREALEWVAEDVVDNGGEAMLWLGRPADRAGLEEMTRRMTAAIAAEYQAVAAEAEQAADTARLTRELRRIADRDYFTGSDRERARQAVIELTARPDVNAPR